MNELHPDCIYMCEECEATFSHDVRKDDDGKWGHICKAKNFREEHRCESFLNKYVKEEQP